MFWFKKSWNQRRPQSEVSKVCLMLRVSRVCDFLNNFFNHISFKALWESQKETHCFKFKESTESKMFKQFLKNWDDTFHEDLKENKKRFSSCSSLITWDNISLLREIRNDSRSQSYMEMENNVQDLKTQINTLTSSVNPFTLLRRKKTFKQRSILGKDWKMQSYVETPKTRTKRFLTFNNFIMTKYNIQNVW